MNKTIIAGIIATIASNANAIGPAPTVEENIIMEKKEVATVDTVIGASAGTSLMATISACALPAAVAHSSGGAILWSGTGYVAGTMGAAAGTVAALPFIAAGAAAVGTGAIVYKYYGEEIDAMYEETMEYINDDKE